MVDLPLGEDDQRVLPRRQDLDTRLERPQVGPFAIDRKDPEPGQVDPVQPGEELIRGHEVERPAHPMAELEHHARIGVVAVVGRDQHPVALRQERRQALQARDLDRLDPEHAAKLPLDVDPPEPAPERVDPGGIELVGQLIGQRKPAHAAPHPDRDRDRGTSRETTLPVTLTYLWSRHRALG